LLNIAPLLPRKPQFLFTPCNNTKESSFGETFFLEATNLSQQTFDLTLPAKDVLFADIHVEENGNVSGEMLNLGSGEEEVGGNVSSLDVIESVKRSDFANLSIPNMKNNSNVLQRSEYSNTSMIGGENHEKIRGPDVNKFKREVERECNIYDGQWVFDESYPLYGTKSCSFIDEGFSCEANGRTDQDYMKWRWKPNHCNIPR
jgi:PMR5 N terminal Domain